MIRKETVQHMVRTALVQNWACVVGVDTLPMVPLSGFVVLGPKHDVGLSMLDDTDTTAKFVNAWWKREANLAENLADTHPYTGMMMLICDNHKDEDDNPICVVHLARVKYYPRSTAEDLIDDPLVPAQATILDMGCGLGVSL